MDRRVNDLRVSWSQDTPLVHNAREAVLSIRDGDLQRQELYLDAEQLRNGSVLYSPVSANVQFRLEVTALDKRKTSETVLTLAAPKAKLAVRNQSVSSSTRDRKSVARPAPLSAQISPLLVVLPPQIPSTPPKTSAVLEELALSQGDLAALPGPPPQRSASGGKTNVSQPSEALSSEQGQFAASPSFVAPHPIRESTPTLPPEIRATLTSEAEVQVKVKIDELGRVVWAEPVGSRGPTSSSLVINTQNAARLWRFAPAMRCVGIRPS